MDEEIKIKALVIMVAVNLLVTCIGCACDGGASDKGESCTKTADCISGLKCVEKVCVKDKTNDGGTLSDGGECYPNCPAVDMVLVPFGEFQMGCNVVVDKECQNNEGRYHVVDLSVFEIDKYEVTTGDYKTCVDNGGCIAPGTDSACNYGVLGRDNHPINCVDWNQANAYCQWVGKRLPTEAEWEKAARGTDGRKYPWGNKDLDCDHAVTSVSPCNNSGTQPVGSKPLGASPYGAEDMIGNVWEWVADWYGSTYYSYSPSNDPQGPTNGSYRVLRGGGWYFIDSYYFRASGRNYNNPTLKLDYNGFRCAR